ncbi:uncharacterized protein [Cherax quadricarinatus]|uniref:uncharacterized protein n=1 Tax=Cherax quadricarinatus TaxID=27406 RepID=UPI00387E2B51
MQTQTCFKSLDDEVSTVSDIYNMVGYALQHQYMFKRRTSPLEMDLWEEGELQNFEVDLKKVDRLYHIYGRDCYGDNYELMVRMAYKDRPIFVEMMARCSNTDFECQGGYIYISFSANIFVDTIRMNYNGDLLELLLSSLREDGYSIPPKCGDPEILESLDDEETTNSDIEKMGADVTYYQHLFTRRTSPWEMDLWGEGELQRFKVDLEKMDHLYDIHCSSGGDYGLLLRMAYKGRPIFVEMVGYCSISDLDPYVGGYMYITFNANLFANIIRERRYNKDHILSLLQKDGYCIPNRESDFSPVNLWQNPPRLMFLCHLTIRTHKDHLKHYPEILPRSLTESLNEFINISEAIEDYNKWINYDN